MAAQRRMEAVQITFALRDIFSRHRSTEKEVVSGLVERGHVRELPCVSMLGEVPGDLLVERPRGCRR